MPRTLRNRPHIPIGSMAASEAADIALLMARARRKAFPFDSWSDADRTRFLVDCAPVVAWLTRIKDQCRQLSEPFARLQQEDGAE